MNKRWPHKRSKHAGKKRVKRDTPILGIEPVTFYREENDKMKRFWDLLAKSIITQSIITVMLVGMACYLWYKYQVIPDRLWTALTFVLGFFFGAKVQQIVGR